MIEYAGVYIHQQPTQILDCGGQWRLTTNQQIDFSSGLRARS
jgi:hypothetical protein